MISDMIYIEKHLGGRKEIRLFEDRVEVDLKEFGKPMFRFKLSKDSFSGSSVWTYERDPFIDSIIRLIFIILFATVLIFGIKAGITGLPFVVCVFTTLLGFIFGANLSPKKKVFVVLSTGGPALLSIMQNSYKSSDGEFESFVKAIEAWIGKSA